MRLYPFILILFLVACNDTTNEEVLEDLVEIEEKEAAEIASEFEDLFISILARADEVNERFMMRLQLLSDSALMSPDFNMGQLIQESELDYIWEDAENDGRVLQGQLVIGVADGIGLDMKMYPDRLIKMEGTAFTTRFGSEDIAGGKGWASTEQTGTQPAIDIENDNTTRPNNAIVHLRLFIAIEE